MAARLRLRFWRRLLVVFLVLAAAALVLWRAGLRFELGGTATRPVITFQDPEQRRIAELERHRTGQGGAPVQALASLSSTPPVAAPAAAAASPWPSYRGAALDGRVREPLALDWASAGPRQLFKQPIGGGYASFVAGEGRVYTIEQRREQEVVAAYDPRSGRELWTNAWSARFSESMGGDGPRATPVFDRGRVFALGANGELRALRAGDGEVLWRRNTLADASAENLTWGQSASPIVVDELVITVPGGRRGGVVAYRAASGEVAWRALAERASYTTPMVIEVAGEPQLLLVMAERALGLSLGGAEPLWQFPWRTQYDVNAAQPLVLPGADRDSTRVFLSAGYGHGAALIEVRREGERYTVNERWQNKNMKNKFSSSVTDGSLVWGLDEGILACVELRTGERRWKGGRYGHGQLLLAGDRLLVIGERGELALVAASADAHRELVSVPALRGKTWNVPAVADGILLVRNGAQMAAYDLRPDRGGS